uniref:Uncharacterized protein n=1 Tax=Anguilla anguilla TaxID=7936 RepID=A0A0E9SSP2_ANGAN
MGHRVQWKIPSRGHVSQYFNCIFILFDLFI